jgi:hypothetical protein
MKHSFHRPVKSTMPVASAGGAMRSEALPPDVKNAT